MRIVYALPIQAEELAKVVLSQVIGAWSGARLMLMCIGASTFFLPCPMTPYP